MDRGLPGPPGSGQCLHEPMSDQGAAGTHGLGMEDPEGKARITWGLFLSFRHPPPSRDRQEAYS